MLSHATKRRALETLVANRLRELLDAFGIDPGDRRERESLIGALADGRRVDFAQVLGELTRSELREICLQLGVFGGGRQKQPIIDRILAADDEAPGDAREATVDDEPEDEAAASASTHQLTSDDKHLILVRLNASRLRAIADALGLELDDRRARASLLAALNDGRRANFAHVLREFSDDELRTACTTLDLPAGGSTKQQVIDRILSLDTRPSDAAVSEEPRVPARKTRSTRKPAKTTSTTGANVGYEAQLWQMADALRGSMDAAEYKHVVLGLIFLKYISDAFDEQHAKLVAEVASGADPEDPDEYRALNIFWVPGEARWKHIQAQAKQPTVGQTVDEAMAAIERDNPALKGVLPKDYARPALDKTRLGQLIDLVSNIQVGDEQARSKDVLGRIYEYFLSQFASAEGKKGGEFYTPRCVVKLLVEMLEPYSGRVYDPCCGSSGMFVQSVAFIRAHATGNGNGNGSARTRAKADISIYGQESNYTTWRLAKMNLAIRGIEGQIAHGDTFHNDRHPDLKADFILANPPFNISDWGGERLRDDKRWAYGAPPAGNANFAWVQHMVHHLAPAGVAGFVLANGSMSSNQSGEGEIRKNLVENDIVDCMVALPGQLFYSTQIPACLWFLARDRKNGSFRDRRGDVLFIDARKLGAMVDRTHRELTDEDIARIADTYHAWRGEKEAGEYEDIPGFCKSATLEEVRKHGHVLTPGRYVGAEAVEEDGEPFEEKMKRLVATLREQQAEAAKLDAEIAVNLKGLGYGE